MCEEAVMLRHYMSSSPEHGSARGVVILTPMSQLYEKIAHRGHKAIHDHTSVHLFAMCFLTPRCCYILHTGPFKKGEKAHEKTFLLFFVVASHIAANDHFTFTPDLTTA